MKKLFLSLLAVVAIVAAMHVSAMASSKAGHKAGHIVVANRGSGDLSVINDRTLVSERVNLSVGGEVVEPMYVNHWRGGYSASDNKVFVGDRANDRVLVLNDKTFEVMDTIPVGQGVFHQWVAPKGQQLWVTSDIDNTVSVINPHTHDVLTTIDIPQDLVLQGGKPHDVFVDRWYAFVTVVGLENDTSQVLRYNTWNFKLSSTVETGGDAHLFVKGKRLYVISQNDSKVRTFNANSLKLLRELDVPNAHGIFVSNKRNRLYVANIAEGGNNAVWTFSKNAEKSFGTTNTAHSVPHNLALGKNEKRLFITHSGENNKVSVMSVKKNSTPVLIGDVTVGNNPFGLGLVR